jgi:hypothetical protein
MIQIEHFLLKQLNQRKKLNKRVKLIPEYVDQVYLYIK